MSEGKFLLIEDDDGIAREVAECLQPLGYRMQHASNGRSGVELALDGGYDFIILDMMLPELGGTEICQKVRESDKKTPILVLSAKSDEVSKVLLLEIGADDYVTKPFSESELRARVKAALRRTSTQRSTDESSPHTVQYLDLAVDFERRAVLKHGEPVQLTVTEYELVALLAATPGRPVSRDYIRDHLFGCPVSGFEQTVSSHVSRLRRKIEDDPANPRYIITVRGFGYVFSDPTGAYSS